MLVVRDENGGVPGAVVYVAQPAPEVASHPSVEGPEGLVEQQHPRLDGQRPGKRHPLSLPSRKLVGKRLSSPDNCTRSRSSSARLRISSFRGRVADGRTSSPKATFAATVMWRKRA